MGTLNSTIKRAAVYARVSLTDKQCKTEKEAQEKHRQETENQLIELHQYCKAQGWQIVKEYAEKQSGKSSNDRAKFQEMMLDAGQRKFDVAVTWALDRLSREGVYQTFDPIHRLKSYRVEYESLEEPQFRTTGPAGELMIALAAWLAKQERIRFSERVKAGMARAKAHGAVFGRRRKITDREKVRELHKQGLGCRAIAKRLGGMSFMTVHRILKTA
jgi:DNA invertase Pin-like site-specific DNA recombinase